MFYNLKEGDVPKEKALYAYRLEGDEETYKSKYDEMIEREYDWLRYNARLVNKLSRNLWFMRAAAVFLWGVFFMVVL